MSSLAQVDLAPRTAKEPVLHISIPTTLASNRANDANTSCNRRRSLRAMRMRHCAVTEIFSQQSPQGHGDFHRVTEEHCDPGGSLVYGSIGSVLRWSPSIEDRQEWL